MVPSVTMVETTSWEASPKHRLHSPQVVDQTATPVDAVQLAAPVTDSLGLLEIS